MTYDIFYYFYLTHKFTVLKCTIAANVASPDSRLFVGISSYFVHGLVPNSSPANFCLHWGGHPTNVLYQTPAPEIICLLWHSSMEPVLNRAYIPNFRTLNILGSFNLSPGWRVVCTVKALV